MSMEIILAKFKSMKKRLDDLQDAYGILVEENNKIREQNICFRKEIEDFKNDKYY